MGCGLERASSMTVGGSGGRVEYLLGNDLSVPKHA